MKTKLIDAKNEMGYLDMRKKLRKTLFKMVIGAAIGVGVSCISGYIALDAFVGYAIFFAFIPCAWSLMPVIIMGPISLCIKVIGSVLLGWIVGPISLIYYGVRLHYYKKKLQQDCTVNAADEM